MVVDEVHTPLRTLVEAFFAYLKRRNKADNTVKRWRPELDRFVAWVGDRQLYEIGVRDLGLEFLADWQGDFRQRNGREPSANSLRAVVQAIKSFYAFAERFEYLVDASGNPVRNPSLSLDSPTIRPVAELDWLRDEEDAALLSCPMGERELILVFFFRMTGLRLSEALALTNRDVDLAANRIVVRKSKTEAGFRMVPISPELRPRIQKWLAYTRYRGFWHPDGPFLVTRNRTAMAPQYVETVLARVGERAGLPRKLKPHTLRRTFGSHLLNKGARLEVVSKLLGHGSTAITERAYARLEDKTVREEMLKALIA